MFVAMGDPSPGKRTYAADDRRSGLDRRRTQSFPPPFSAQRRRTSRGRRKTDRGAYVDSYDMHTCAVAIGVLALSLLDAILTGIQIMQGKSREANPLMNMVIHQGGLVTFFSLKVAMTSFPLAILVVHKEWTLARYAARLCLACYVVIALYHLYLVLL